MHTPQKAFTLLELLIVVILVAIIISFALPKYDESVRKSIEKEARTQLLSIYAVNALYYAQANYYIVGPLVNVGAINGAFDLSIIANELTYSYTNAAPDAYEAIADFSGSKNFQITIDEKPLKTDNPGANPCCFAGTCQTVPDCI